MREILIKRWIASVFFGKKPEYKIHGTKEQLVALAEALLATYNLNSEINESCCVQFVAETLRKKHVATNKFEKVFKMKWPL